MENNNIKDADAAADQALDLPPLSPWEKFLEEVNPDHTSFYVKVGDRYDGVNFTLDPHVHQFEEADNLDLLVYEDDGAPTLDLPKLRALLEKCRDVQHLKFFGVKIAKDLIEIISEHCPKLINLELNPFHEGWGLEEPVLGYLPEFKGLLQRCENLATLIIRRPTDNVVEYIEEHGYDSDKIDRNFCFNHHTRSTYQMHPDCEHQSASPSQTGRMQMAIGVQTTFGSKYAAIYQKMFH